jgi:small-conductance mechanosensitive channel
MPFVRSRKLLTGTVLAVLLLSAHGVPETGIAGHDVIAFLNQAIQWYRQISSDQQLANDASDVLYLENLRDLGLETLRNCFDFARAEAALRPKDSPADATPQDSNAEGQPAINAQNLAQRAVQAQARVKQSQEELDSLEKKLPTLTGKKRQTLTAQIAETRSELELAQARSDTLNGFVQFITSSASGNHAGLGAQIDELERTVPELRPPPASSTKKSGVTEAAAASKAAAPPAAQRKQQASGLIGMIEESFAFNAKISAQKDAQRSTADLRSALQKLRAPLMQELRTTSQQGDSLTQAPDLNDAAAVEQRANQISDLTVRFKQDSGAIIPLGKSLVLLDSVRATLAEWRSDTDLAYRQELKRLLVRVVFLLIAIAVVFGASEVWRSATMRYVQDIRRRNQIMLLRRIAVTLAIFLIILFMLVTEVGSIATFAGFITAGLAVALQTVILSVVAYFLLIGKWGIRVGDRVCISGVTGDVIDIGLVRMHLMEVDGNGGDEQPTGRVVVFSNAVLFQPTANFFKQIPGTNFSWHRVTLTLAPETDYKRAEQLLMDAVNHVFADYRDEIKRQHNTMQQTLTIPVKPPTPQSRFRFTDAGLELLIRYPVPLDDISMMEDQVTRALVQALRAEPSLRLVKQGNPAIQPVAESPHMEKPA